MILHAGKECGNGNDAMTILIHQFTSFKWPVSCGGWREWLPFCSAAFLEVK